jgi:hypothetical protein
MLNLFAYRATCPQDLKRAADSIGPDNDRYLLREVQAANLVIACWGNHGSFLRRDEQVLSLLAGVAVKCLSKNKDGSPHHPLYLRPDIQPQPMLPALSESVCQNSPIGSEGAMDFSPGFQPWVGR